MTGQRRVLTDDLLTQTLRLRAGNADEYLLEAVLATTTTLPQRRSWGRPMTRGVLTAGVAVLLLMLALAAALVVGGGRLPLPSPPIESYHHNGDIVLMSGGSPVEVDLQTGMIVTDTTLHLPKTFTPESPVTGLAWSSDGMQLALISPRGLSLLDVRTGDLNDVVACGSAGCAVEWSPDGSALAVAHMGYLYVIDLTTDEPVSLPSAWLTAAGPAGRPSWFPDSQRIRFFREDALWAINRDGTGLKRLGDTWNAESVWSPDGTQVAWISSSPWTSTDGTNLTLNIGPADGSATDVNLDMGTCFCLGWTPGLTWSPDGTMVAFSSLGGGTSSLADGLYEIGGDGTGLRRVGPSGWGPPAWRPVP